MNESLKHSGECLVPCYCCKKFILLEKKAPSGLKKVFKGVDRILKMSVYVNLWVLALSDPLYYRIAEKEFLRKVLVVLEKFPSK